MNAPASPEQGAISANLDSSTVDAAILEEQRRIDEGTNPLSLEPVEGEPEADTEVPEEGDDAQVSEAEPEPELVEVEYNGKKYSVPPEIREGVMLQADYTRKSMALAEQRKAIGAQSESLQKMFEVGEQYMQARAARMGVQQQLGSVYQELSNNPRLESDDPLRYSALGTRIATLQAQLQAIDYSTNQAERQHTEFQTRQRAASIQEGREYLAARGFTDAKLREVGEFIKTLNLPDKVIAAIDGGELPQAFEFFDEVRQFRQMKQAKDTVKAKVASAPPVVKPGSAPQKVSSSEIAAKKLRSSGSVRDAIALEMAMMSKRR